MKAYHFLRDDRRLRWGDHREPIRPGTVIELPRDRPLKLCSWGLHASKRPIDALNYAPGPVLCEVRLTGGLIHDTDKSVGYRREVVWMANVERELHEFACWCAEGALKAAGVDDERCWQAIATKRAWLNGEVGDGDLAATRAVGAARAAWAVASAGAAARAAGAARAARAAARVVASAGGVAWVADAAGIAAGDGQNAELMRMIAALEWEEN